MNITANSSIMVIKLNYVFGFGNYILQLAVHTIVILAQRFAKGIYEYFSISVRSSVTCLSESAFDHQILFWQMLECAGTLRLALSLL